MALGYRGTKDKANSITNTPKQCQEWSKVPIDLRPTSWNFGSITVGNPHDLSLEGNFCRNPDNDVHGPWCITDLDTMTAAYCEIDYCGKLYSIAFQ